MSGEKMRPIGIVGGAGPMAGMLLGQKIVERCQKEYGCVSDADFPTLIIYSFPFTEMLDDGINSDKISEQLALSLEFLEKNCAECIAIACNTLHAFLDPYWKGYGLVNVIEETRKEIEKDSLSKILVLCTSTSRNSGIFNIPSAKFPTAEQQRQVDKIIAKVLGGDFSPEDSKFFERIFKSDDGQPYDGLLLGCSELSVLNQKYPLKNVLGRVIDPLDIVSNKLCQYSFKKGEKLLFVPQKIGHEKIKHEFNKVFF